MRVAAFAGVMCAAAMLGAVPMSALPQVAGMLALSAAYASEADGLAQITIDAPYSNDGVYRVDCPCGQECADQGCAWAHEASDMGFYPWAAKTLLFGSGVYPTALYNQFVTAAEPEYRNIAGYILTDSRHAVLSGFLDVVYNGPSDLSTQYLYEVIILEWLQGDDDDVFTESFDKACDGLGAIEIADDVVEGFIKLGAKKATGSVQDALSGHLGRAENLSYMLSTLDTAASAAGSIRDVVHWLDAALGNSPEKITLLEYARDAAASTNEQFVNAANRVIDAYAGEIGTLSTSLVGAEAGDTLYQTVYGLIWDKFAESNPYVATVKIGMSALDFAFGTGDSASANTAMLGTLVVDSFLNEGLRTAAANARDAYNQQGAISTEQGEDFVSCFESYLDFRSYAIGQASEWAEQAVGSDSVKSLFISRDSKKVAQSIVDSCATQQQTTQLMRDAVSSEVGELFASLLVNAKIKTCACGACNVPSDDAGADAGGVDDSGHAPDQGAGENPVEAPIDTPVDAGDGLGDASGAAGAGRGTAQQPATYDTTLDGLASQLGVGDHSVEYLYSATSFPEFKWVVSDELADGTPVGTLIRDFDGDGQDELLVAVWRNHTVDLDMYEDAGGTAVLTATMVGDASSTFPVRGFGLFEVACSDDGAIYLQWWYHTAPVADGHEWVVERLDYRDGDFALAGTASAAGTGGVPLDELRDEMYALGLDASYVPDQDYMNDSSAMEASLTQRITSLTLVTRATASLDDNLDASALYQNVNAATSDSPATGHLGTFEIGPNVAYYDEGAQASGGSAPTYSLPGTAGSVETAEGPMAYSNFCDVNVSIATADGGTRTLRNLYITNMTADPFVLSAGQYVEGFILTSGNHCIHWSATTGGGSLAIERLWYTDASGDYPVTATSYDIDGFHWFGTDSGGGEFRIS